MQGLSPTQVQAMTGACTPGIARLTAYLLIGGLAVTLLAQGLAVGQVLSVLSAAVLSALMLTGPASTTMLTRECMPLARHVLVRAATTS